MATGDSLDHAPYTFIGRRQGSPDWRVCARLDHGSGRSGLSVHLDEAHHYDLEVSAGLASVIASIGPLRQVVGQRSVSPGPVTLVVDIRIGHVPSPTEATGDADRDPGDAGGPDTISFSLEGPEEPIAELDGRYLSTEVATGFTGRVIGMYVTSGVAHFDWYEGRAT